MIKKTIRKRGAPGKRDDEKVLPNGLLPEQWEWLKSEANARGLSAATVHREAVDWYITMKDTKRGDVNASQMFDDTLKEVK